MTFTKVAPQVAKRGSKPGERRGGRQKGTPNKASSVREKRIAESGKTPLEIMISVMRDTYEEAEAGFRKASSIKGQRLEDKARKADLLADARKLRAEAHGFAVSAAPYVHPKLQSVLHGADPTKPVRVVHSVDNETLARMSKFILG